VQADSHLDDNVDPLVYANTLRNIVADKPDFLIDLGDTFMTDKYPAYQDAAPQYLAQRFYFGLIGQAAPVFLVLGNHDGEAGWPTLGGGMNGWSSAMRSKYFPPVVTNSFYSAGPANASYYAWTWGDALFVVLDPFTQSKEKPRGDDDGWVRTLGKLQYDWLQSLLASSHARYKFVFIHHLVGGADKDSRGGSEASVFYEWGGENRDGTPGFASHRPGWPMPIHDLLVANHVTVVFHGHDHLYVRQKRDGIVYQEVPQPGEAREGNIRSAEEYGYRSGKLLGSSGDLRITISPAAAKVEYVRSRLSGVNAQVADSYLLQPCNECTNRGYK
jgi:predicted phosphodiesterase